MSNYKLTIENHPAQARFAGKPLFDDEGRPIPLFPDQRSIRMDGQVVAYVSKDSVNFIHSGLPPAIKAQAIELAKAAFGEIETVATVPDLIDDICEDDEE
jgi:hypothetical protein